jgi:hypothetical protein
VGKDPSAILGRGRHAKSELESSVIIIIRLHGLLVGVVLANDGGNGLFHQRLEQRGILQTKLQPGKPPLLC